MHDNLQKSKELCWYYKVLCDLIQDSQSDGRLLSQKYLKTCFLDKLSEYSDTTTADKKARERLNNQLNRSIRFLEFVELFGEYSLLFCPNLSSRLNCSQSNWTILLNELKALYPRIGLRDPNLIDNPSFEQVVDYYKTKTQRKLESLGYPSSVLPFFGFNEAPAHLMDTDN